MERLRGVLLYGVRAIDASRRRRGSDAGGDELEGDAERAREKADGARQPADYARHALSAPRFGARF